VWRNIRWHHECTSATGSTAPRSAITALQHVFQEGKIAVRPRPPPWRVWAVPAPIVHGSRTINLLLAELLGQLATSRLVSTTQIWDRSGNLDRAHTKRIEYNMKTSAALCVLAFGTILAAITPVSAQVEEGKTTSAPGGASTGIDILPDWMETMPNVPISWLTIPGTHDSGAMYEAHIRGFPIAGTAAAQNLIIPAQLEKGVRFLDIRCRSFENKFVIHHEMVYQNLTFDEVLDDCTRFLSAHPSETLIMSVKEEYTAQGSTLGFQEIMAEYMARNPALWYRKNAIPNLDEVRGKIVLLRRFAQHAHVPGAAPDPDGIDASGWSQFDNRPTPFSLDDGQLSVEDYYAPPNGPSDDAVNDKWISIVANAYLCQNDPSATRMCISFASASTNDAAKMLQKPILFYSTRINPLLMERLFNTKGKYGIIAMDYVNEDLCRAAVDSNTVSIFR